MKIGKRSGLVLGCILSASAAFGGDAVAPGGGLSPTALYMRAGTVDTAAPSPALARAIGAYPAGTRFVIQLDGPITPARRAQLAAAGVRLGDYLPMYAYIATLDGADAEAAGGLEFVRWWSVYEDGWKLDPEVGQRAYVTPERQALAAQGRDCLTVVVFAGHDLGPVEKAIWSIPGAVIVSEEVIADHVELAVEMNLADAPKLAAMPGVQYIEPAGEFTERNATSRWIVQSNQAGVFPLYAAGLMGQGQIIGIIDSGAVSGTHCSFTDTAPVGPTHRKLIKANTTTAVSSHASHCAGIAAGDAGSDTADTRGVAYQAKLTYNRYPSLPASDATMSAMLQLSHDDGARVHTNSWGNDGTTSYDGTCRGIDVFQYNNEDSLVLFAVTNQSALKNPENAKNLVAVGATSDTPSQANHCYGGTGPTSDGRRKPEIYAPGCSILSASTSGCSTTSNSGTSMACPAVSGVSTLVRQYYVDGYYPTGEAGGESLSPTAALVKATVLNSGANMAPAGYPGNQEGWGRVLAANSLYFPGSARKLLVEDVRNADGLSTGDEVDLNINVLGDGQQLRVTLVWTEPPATAGAGFASINDLDLEVVSPGGVVYLGNVFNTATGDSTIGGAKDNRNNVEQVHMSAPEVGPWTVRIKGANVAQGAQGYALVVTGDIQGGIPPGITMSLATPVPGLVAPGDAFNVDVNVIPGSQGVVPGSPTAWYRSTTAGTYIGTPMTSLGANVYRASFPAQVCENDPEFYFSADGDEGFLATLPRNAPAGIFGTLVGTIGTSTILTESFESGLPSGWTTTGLWNVGSNCAPSGSCDGTTWAYYGQPGTCNYNTGVATSGQLTSAPIALPSIPPGGTITLSYCSAKVSENNSSYDKTTVLANGAVVDTAVDSAAFATRTADLTSLAGQSVTLAWKFDSVDSINNSFRGWHVDNVRITVVGAECDGNPPACYANCDLSTAAPVLNVADFTCFLQRFAAAESYANCDESSVEPVLNVADFTCFLQKFAAGCP